MLRARARDQHRWVQGFILNALRRLVRVKRARYPQARPSLSEVETEALPQIFHNQSREARRFTALVTLIVGGDVCSQRRMGVMYDRCGEVVIKDDLRIAGERVKIVSQNKIQIDCEFEGDVTGPEVVVSERGKVTGNVAGDRVIVLGKIVGDIRGKMVALLSTAHVEGDIHHASLAIDAGAEFAGRCRHTDVGGWPDGRRNAA